MANPVVIPHRPIDSTSSSVSLLGEFAFTTDDEDSSISRQSLNTTGFYGSITEETDFLVQNFRDTGANPTKSSSINVFKYNDNRIELSVSEQNGDFNSAIFFTSETKTDTGFGFTVQLQVNSFSIASSPRPYFQSNTFTGISFGIYDFKTGSAVVLFLKDNSEIDVAGPASDVTGTRITHTASYNWSSETIYSILADYELNLITVTANTNESDEDTILFKGSLSSLGLCLESTSMANKFKSDDDNLIAFVSQDGRQLGDTITIKKLTVFDYATKYIVNGAFTNKTLNGVINTKDSDIFSKQNIKDRFKTWTSSNVVQYTSSEIYTALSFSSQAGYVAKPFKSLTSDSFFMFVTINVTETSFSGVNTGLGIDIKCTKLVSFRFIDGGIGLRKTTDPNAIRLYTGYHTKLGIDTLIPIDIGIVITGGNVKFLLKNTNEKYEVVLNESISGLPNNSGDTEVSFVSESGLKGVMFVSNMIMSTTVPDDIVIQSINTAQDVVQGSLPAYLVVPPTKSFSAVTFNSGHHQISGQYVTPSKYDNSSSGVVVLCQFLLTVPGSIMPGSHNGPFILINTKSGANGIVTHGIGMYFTKGIDNKTYMYFAGDSQDSREVAYQTNKGKAISVEVDIMNSLFLLLRYSPTTGFYVYDVNDSMSLLHFTPIIDIDGIEDLIPNPGGHGLFLPVDGANNNQFLSAIGHLNLNILYKFSVNLFLTGTGRGLDTSFYIDNSRLSTYLYGSRSRLLVSAEDND